MKKIISFVFIITLSLISFAQEGNLGAFLGASYYIGELNQRSVFYMPSPAFGFLYRHNFDKRWALKLEGSYTTLRGDDAKSDNSYQIHRGYSFSNKMWDIGAEVELNFKNYDKDRFISDYFTPYISTGALLLIAPDSRRNFEFAIPIGFGFKYAVTSEITAGMEWTYRWTNSDMLDGLAEDNYEYAIKQLSYNPNFDWYSYLFGFVTIRIFKEDITCPAF